METTKDTIKRIPMLRDTKQRKPKTIVSGNPQSYIKNKLYNSQRWRTLRELKIQQSPLCEICISGGVVRPTEEIHHITPISTGLSFDDMQVLCYDFDNLQSLCKDCHRETHKSLKH